jgi:hypothetical protein
MDQFTQADFLAYADKHGIPVYCLESFAEYEEESYKQGILHFTVPSARLELFQHIHNLNVVAEHMLAAGQN